MDTEKEVWSCGAITKHRPLENVIFGVIKPEIFETRRKGLLLQFPVETLAVEGKCCHQHLERIEKKDSLNDWEAPPPTGDWRRHFASSDREEGDKVLITLMDRNINTVKKLSSVQQIKAMKPSREKAKVEELRLDINHTQQ